ICHSCQSGTTISIVIKQLAHQRRSPIWHHTCSRRSRRQRNGCFEFKGRRCVSASLAQPNASLPYKIQGTQISLSTLRRVVVWSPPLPQLGGSYHEQSSDHRPAVGRSSCNSGPRADHLV